MSDPLPERWPGWACCLVWFVLAILAWVGVFAAIRLGFHLIDELRS